MFWLYPGPLGFLQALMQYFALYWFRPLLENRGRGAMSANDPSVQRCVDWIRYLLVNKKDQIKGVLGPTLAKINPTHQKTKTEMMIFQQA